jgi:UDP-glucose 4-epimerase
MFLVTGGAGFIGSHLVTRLVERGEAVRVFDNFSTGTPANLDAVRDQVIVVAGDIRDQDAVHAAIDGVNVVFHQAALSSVQGSITDPSTTLEINITGTLNVFEAARDAGCQSVEVPLEDGLMQMMQTVVSLDDETDGMPSCRGQSRPVA